MFYVSLEKAMHNFLKSKLSIETSSDVDENGNEISEHNVHDIMFVDGKIKKINVYRRRWIINSQGKT